jgi:hypothetical protein
MKIITKRKAKKYIENEIDTLKVDEFIDEYDAFNSVYEKMNALYDLGVLTKTELDKFWVKLRIKTTC